MKDILNKYFLDYRTILVFLGIFVIIASLQSYFAPLSLAPNNLEYTRYNNYIIFKQSFIHLIQSKDLFILYPHEYWDLYKYSPTFSLFFAPFAAMPDILGLILWNLINALAVFFALKYLPLIADRQKIYMLWFIFLELFTCLQNEQSNGLMAGLIIGAFVLLERKQLLLATFCIVFSVYVKIFGAVAFSLLLLYPNKLRSILYSILWIIILACLPLVAVSAEQLKFLYISWGKLLANDHSISDGFSVIGWLNRWFSFYPNKLYVLITGIIIFCIPLLRFKLYKDYLFRTMILASVLIWVIIFNHKAESPTFVIAISGVALWYFSAERKKLDLILLVIAFAFTIMAPTDFYPPFIRNEIFKPYVVKAVPCILIWAKLIYDTMVYNKKAWET
ncbi:MAG TPA: glycosyltransferase family 87 protein [Bacteroidales bacterium]|nr:glycosyltransferase family 87 protein [Bacteroidales bacterium]